MESGSYSAYQAPASPSQVRFSQTPPESPKSCMKGARRLNFAEPDESEVGGSGSSQPGTSNDTTLSWKNQPDSSSYVSSPKSPRKSAKIVMIKSPVSGSTSTPTGIIGGDEEEVLEEDEIPPSSTTPEFQFHLSQHYETSPILPNCTSNGSYEEYLRQKQEQERLINKSDTNYDTSFSFDILQSGPNQYDPQLVEIATKFVNEIIEKAKTEVVNRQKAEGKQRTFSISSTLVDRGRDLLQLGNAQIRSSNLLRRARGTISSWVTNICVKAQNAVKT